MFQEPKPSVVLNEDPQSGLAEESEPQTLEEWACGEQEMRAALDLKRNNFWFLSWW